MIKVRNLNIEMGLKYLGLGQKNSMDHILFFQIILKQPMDVIMTGKRL